MDKYQAKQEILKLLQETEKLILDNSISVLDTIGELQHESEWSRIEHNIWKNGETIRQLFNQIKSLKQDNELLDRINLISLNRDAKRGRQSFIMLLWNKNGAHYADKLVNQLDDKFVYGHIIEGLNKMKVPGYVMQVKPFCIDKIPWIRKQAIKYINTYSK